MKKWWVGAVALFAAAAGVCSWLVPTQVREEAAATADAPRSAVPRSAARDEGLPELVRRSAPPRWDLPADVELVRGLDQFMAQSRGYGRRGGGGYGGWRGEEIDPNDRRGVPTWEVDKNFKHDTFRFVRVRYQSWRRGWGWSTDYPDSDLNFPFRLQQLTSMKCEPQPKIVELTDDELFDYPWIYMIEPGGLRFSEEEIVALRRYLLNGGFLMVDDFWGEEEWENFYSEIKRVFPDREPVELPIEHPIFHCVYNLKEKPQVPAIGYAQRYRGTNITWERSDAREVHYKGIFDDKGRLMSIICHNTDLGDGWEREGEDEYYFREFSEKKAYPMGINIVFYAMTH